MKTNRITTVDEIVKAIINMLPDNSTDNCFITNYNKTEILSKEESEIEAIANLFDQLYGEGTCTTGYYDPEEDNRNNEVDTYTGMYYISFE